MSFFKEAANALGLDYIRLSAGYQLINYNGEALYIEGVRRILSIDENQIQLAVGKKRLCVLGSNLQIVDISGAVLMIRGVITACELPDERNASEQKKAAEDSVQARPSSNERSSDLKTGAQK